MSQTIIFTDLDGTLLNHENYDYELVCPLLARLKALDIPVILNSSKTLAELEQWQIKLGLTALPVVAENGGIIKVFDENTQQSRKILIGQPYEEILHYIRGLRTQYGWEFEGFGDWTVSEVMNYTGLHAPEAVLAMEREVTEPILWQGSEAEKALFEAELAKKRLKLKKGGRFLHVMGQHDKADAMQFLMTEKYPPQNGALCQIVALGDSDNDIEMLNYADISIVMPPGSGKTLTIDKAKYAKVEAPIGWVEEVQKILGDKVV